MGFKIKKKKSFFNRSQYFDKIDVLSEAIDLLNAKKWPEALEAAQKAVKTYPNERRFWEVMADASVQLGELPALQKAYGRLVAFDANDDVAWFGLAQAYIMDGRIALSLHIYRQFLERFPDDPKADKAEANIEILEKELERILKDFGLPDNEESFELACQHEKAQVVMHQGNPAQAVKLGEELIKKAPDFAPAFNNLSLSYFQNDQPEKAVETAEKVLQMQPENFHALGNLAKFNFFLGRREESANYAELLQKTESENPMIYAKKVETFAFLGDDEAVVKTFKDFQKKKIKIPESEGFIKHLAAFSFYQLGKEKEARKLWKEAAEESGGELAKRNYSELALPAHDRNLFSLPLNYWVSGKLFDELLASVNKVKDGRNFDKKLQDKIRQFFKKYPNVLALFSNILERADLAGKEFVIKLIEWSNLPEALEMLKEFAFGKKGSDSARYIAAISLTQADYISNSVELWKKGELTEVMLLSFEVTYEPTEVEGYPLKPKTINLMQKGVVAGHQQNFDLAKQYYELALNVQPDHPSLLYNLLTTRFNLGEKIDLRAELESLVSRFPDYSFAALSLALDYVREEKIEEAEKLIKRFYDKKKWHVTEIALWCRLNMEILLAKEEYEGAKMWFDMLKQFDERNDHSQLEKFFEQADLLSKVTKILEKEKKAGRKKKK